jgi:predicted NAD/FAD-dependent oxidoreductase
MASMIATVPESSVVVVGAGIAGIACAREVQAAGVDVTVLERGRVVGGRMARWTRDGRAVDIGAAYFTVRTPEFDVVAESWARRGLAHPWTDTFTVAGAGGSRRETSGPVRWAAEAGLRSLVADLADGLDVRLAHEVSTVSVGSDDRVLVDGRPVRGLVLAMPDPQAGDLLGQGLEPLADALDEQWQPVVSVAVCFAERTWHGIDGVFVHDSPISLVVDDGRRRGDGAPVLVVHSTHETARHHLDDPSAVVPLALAEVRRLLGDLGEPVWAEAKRWGSAEPRRPRQQTFLLGEAPVAVCGDGWSSRPRVEAAWLSGRDAGRALVDRLR